MPETADQYLALGNPTRLALVKQLRRGPRTVNELARGLPVSRPAVSQQLKVLVAAGVAEEEWTGNFHYYRLNPRTLARLRADLDAMWQDALEAFARHVERREAKHSP